jgi:histidinol-phosphatase (PHP family)
MKSNYHTHLHFCNHAEGTSKDYAIEAIKHGFEVLGISDHAPNETMTDHYVRMKQEMFDIYLKDMEAAQEEFEGKIKILKGIEVEFWYDHDDYYKLLRSKLDYLVHGQHYISKEKTYNNLVSGFGLHTKEQIYLYAEYLMDAMDTGYFDIMAHPDLYMCGYKDFDKDAARVAHMIAKKAEETNTILEYNGNGFNRGVSLTPQGYKLPYPRNEFWEIVKEYNVRTMLNSDCHTPGNMYDDAIMEAEEEYEKLGLKRVHFIDIK